MDEHFDEHPQTVQDYLRVLLRDVQDIKAQTTKTNGRVSVLEDWRSSRETKDREQAAFREGASSALLTKKQAWAALGVTATLSTIAGSVAGIVVKVAL